MNVVIHYILKILKDWANPHFHYLVVNDDGKEATHWLATGFPF